MLAERSNCATSRGSSQTDRRRVACDAGNGDRRCARATLEQLNSSRRQGARLYETQQAADSLNARSPKNPRSREVTLRESMPTR